MRGGGCLFPILLIVFIGLVLGFDDDDGAPRTISEAPAVPEGPIREDVPAIAEDAPQYGIEEPGPARDSQGTGFALARNGLWMTAEHVVDGCNLVGLATSPDRAEKVDRVVESQVSDAALITDGLSSGLAFALSKQVPARGATGYHMGFPAGEPSVVQSELIGQANAVRAGGMSQPILAWAEVDRYPRFEHPLSGISGGPTFDAQGRVVGVNSAASERRGRVLTVHPRQLGNLVRAAGRAAEPDAPIAITSLAAAAALFERYYRLGAIRQVFCEVVD